MKHIKNCLIALLAFGYLAGASLAYVGNKGRLEQDIDIALAQIEQEDTLRRTNYQPMPDVITPEYFDQYLANINGRT
ncbi:MAG: hypothetical protein ACMXYK_00495 [Candidatus Woesearchaeota archaeon]